MYVYVFKPYDITSIFISSINFPLSCHISVLFLIYNWATILTSFHLFFKQTFNMNFLCGTVEMPNKMNKI